LARHCPECGFVVTEGANYCQRCGAYVGTLEEKRDDATTATYMVDENTGELKPVDVGDVAAATGALVIRSGGGKVGQSFPLEGERLTIGRSPDAEIFLDDVTVSRDHAVLVRRSGSWFLDDSGSLNGTYVNRRRIESHKLEDGDELQHVLPNLIIEVVILNHVGIFLVVNDIGVVRLKISSCDGRCADRSLRRSVSMWIHLFFGPLNL